jgi:hypothetical protein
MVSMSIGPLNLKSQILRGNGMLEKLYFVVSRKDISFMRFILESYDGLLFMRTIDAAAGVIEVGYHPSRRPDAQALLKSLAEEVGLQAIDPPEKLDSFL